MKLFNRHEIINLILKTATGTLIESLIQDFLTDCYEKKDEEKVLERLKFLTPYSAPNT